MAAEIREGFPDVTVTLVPSKGGRFEVLRDDVPIFEKSKLKRHAEPGEVMRILRDMPDSG